MSGGDTYGGGSMLLLGTTKGAFPARTRHGSGDGENIRFLGGLDTPVADRAEVFVLPSVSGG
ncbi:hypothetical protein [Candidatus Palauibacter sp.]|uniref:hypothetical protein n=1 Tax=Candidatus Palauibacter sp. TaxID=3101350 RepID=UPI003AF1F50D